MGRGRAGGPIAALLLLCAVTVAASGCGPAAAEQAAMASRSGQAVEADTVRVPRAPATPAADCEIGEWPGRARLHLRPGLPDVVVEGPSDGRSDLTVRAELQWVPDTLWVMVDVRDDSVEGGLAAGGDWVQLGLESATLWIAAPGRDAAVARMGTRATGKHLATAASCRTPYGWTAEVAVPAGRLANDPALAALYHVGLFAEDDDGEGARERRTVMWRDAVAFLGPLPEGARAGAGAPEGAGEPGAPPAPPDLLQRIREERVTLRELSRRPGARDTTLVRGGKTVPAVRLPLEGGAAVAFAPTRDSPEVTYRVDRDQTVLLELLGMNRSRATLELQFGDLRMVEEEETVIRSPEFRLDLLGGVRIQFGPATPGDVGEPPAAARPVRVYIETEGARR